MQNVSCSMTRSRPGRAPELPHFPVSKLRRSRLVPVTLAALSIGLAGTGAMGQGAPILNSPYVCANGITYTVTICKPYRTDQWCETTEMQNGRLVTAMDSAWSSMTGRLKGCTNAANGKPQAAGTPAAAAEPPGGAQQTLNPAYLREFPTVDQIMAQLKGTSPQDTAYRQLTALHEFGQMIAALAGPRMAQNHLTSDEVRILTNYYNAYTSLAKSTANARDAYAGNDEFTVSLFATFHMPTIQQLWETSKNMAANQQSGARPLPQSNDPSQIAIRRCFELGGTGLQCVGTGMSEGLKQMIGIDISKLTSSNKAGLVILGNFNASSGLTFAFADGSLDISNCGKMVQGGHDYSVSVSGGKYVIKIANQPQAFVITLGTDGKAAGPAAQDITGQQITGYEVTTNVKTGVVVGRTPVFGPITVHCAVGMLTRGPDVILDQGLASGGMGILSGLGSVMGMLSGDPQANSTKQPTLPPGPRMKGTYTGAGGMKIQFNDSNAVIDCAQAHVLAQYDVALQGEVPVVAVKSGGANPFNLSVQSSGSLAGSGKVTVNGKLMTGMDDNANPIFAPTSATCLINELTAAK